MRSRSDEEDETDDGFDEDEDDYSSNIRTKSRGRFKRSSQGKQVIKKKKL